MSRYSVTYFCSVAPKELPKEAAVTKNRTTWNRLYRLPENHDSTAINEANRFQRGAYYDVVIKPDNLRNLILAQENTLRWELEVGKYNYFTREEIVARRPPEIVELMNKTLDYP